MGQQSMFEPTGSGNVRVNDLDVDSDRSRARGSDPDTSKDAIPGVDEIRESQKEVLWLAYQAGDGFIDHDIVRVALRKRIQSPSGVRTRRKELVDKGFIRDSGETAPTPGERDTEATVWTITEYGRKYVSEYLT